MNNVQLVGKLVRDPEVRYSANGKAVARFTVACSRRFKTEGQPDADFISCLSFGKTAEFVEKYFSKGKWIGLTGSINTGSYEKDGKKVYTTDVLVDNVEFVGGKSSEDKNEKKANEELNVPEGFTVLNDDEMPF